MNRDTRDTAAGDRGETTRTESEECAENESSVTSVHRDASRRDFLKTTASAGVLAGATALTLPAVSGQTVAEETCEDGATFDVGGGDFEVINNKWGNPSAEQCIQRYDDGRYGWTFSGGSSNTDNINYPEVYVGTRPWGSDTGVREFPIARGDVDELTMEWDFDIDVQAGQEWNLTEEWWLLDGQPTSQNPPLTHEIMLVCEWSPQHSHGGVEEANVRTDRYGNQIDYWAHYPQGGTNADFHIFRINGGASTGQVDLTQIVDFMDERHGLRQDLTMTGIELGTETMGGPTGEVVANTFDVTINGSTYTSGLQDGTDSGTGGDTGTGTGGETGTGSGTGSDSGTGATGSGTGDPIGGDTGSDDGSSGGWWGSGSGTGSGDDGSSGSGWFGSSSGSGSDSGSGGGWW